MWPEIGVYVGAGASHSWTWCADIFERQSWYSVSFINECDIAHGVLDTLDVFIISGGDTFAIADGLGVTGAQKLRAFVAGGGVYMGTCAGAYLPLRTSLPPLNQFNFVTSRIANLTRNLPTARKMAEKYCTDYGCRYIFHPVRAAVMVKIVNGFSCTGDELSVPLYGGPAMTPSDDIEVLGVYSGFTGGTEFLVEERIAEHTLIGNVAIARKHLGNGALYLFGPHFEHPQFAAANRIFIEAMCAGSNKHASTRKELHLSQVGQCTARHFEILRSEISNARIVAYGLEHLAYRWRIGKKVYEPEKISVFLEAIWSRIRTLKYDPSLSAIAITETDELINLAQTVTARLRNLKKQSNTTNDTSAEAAELFTYLKNLTARFLSIYFRIKAGRVTGLQIGNAKIDDSEFTKGEVA